MMYEYGCVCVCLCACMRASDQRKIANNRAVWQAETATQEKNFSNITCFPTYTLQHRALNTLKNNGVAIEPKTGEPQIVQPSTLPGSKAACKLCISALLGAMYHKQQVPFKPAVSYLIQPHLSSTNTCHFALHHVLLRIFDHQK